MKTDIPIILALTAICLGHGASARAEEPSCRTDFAIEACANGSGSVSEIKEAARQYRKLCRRSSEKIQLQPKLKAHCAKPGKGDALVQCNEQWDKQSRSLGRVLDDVFSQKKEINKISASLAAPYACDAQEKSKSHLHELALKLEALGAAVKPVREDARSMSGIFQQEFTKTLIDHPVTDPSKHYAGQQPDSPLPPPKAGQISKMGSVDRVTAYRIVLEVNFPGPKDATIDVAGTPVKVTPGFAKALRLEGSGVLTDGRMVNSSGGKYVLVPVIRAPYGVGSYKRTPLEPYRSIAVDPKEIPLGSTVFIYEARGMPIQPAPDGTPLAHDGYFRAIDVGGAILGTHIDIFTGHTAEDYSFVQKFFYNRTVHYFVIK